MSAADRRGWIAVGMAILWLAVIGAGASCAAAPKHPEASSAAPERGASVGDPAVHASWLAAYAQSYAAYRGFALDPDAASSVQRVAHEMAARLGDRGCSVWTRTASCQRFLGNAKGRLQTEIDLATAHIGAPASPQRVVSEELDAFTRSYAAERGFRLGAGADHDLGTVAWELAREVVDLNPATIPAGKAVAQARLRRTVDAMIAYVAEHPEYAQRSPNVIGEETLAAANLRLGLGAGSQLGAPGATPLWRFRLERGGHRVESLTQGNVSNAVVELAIGAKGGGTKAAEKTLVEELDRRAADANPEPIQLTAYLLPDLEHFDPAPPSTEVLIDVAAYKQYRKAAAQGPLVLARALLPLKPRGNARGPASIAVLFWKDGTPIDELVVRVCIAPAGEGICRAPEIIPGESKPDPVRPLTGDVPQPEVAMHVVELGPYSNTMGLLRASGRTYAWKIDGTFADLEATGRETVATALKVAHEAQSERGIRQAGWVLFNTLFPPPAPGDEGDGGAARAAFAKLVLATLEPATGNPRVPPRTLFVRLVPLGQHPPPLLPLGVLSVLPPDRQERGVVGLRYRIDMPLPRQAYAPTACPKSWFVVGPSEGEPDEELKDAYRRGLLQAPWPIESTFSKFREWGTTQAESDRTVLLYVGHHHENHLFFTNDDDRMAAKALVRRFQRPSVAILNGCGTLAPGAGDWVTWLNRQGMDATIATSMTVSGAMAGDYVSCLRKELGRAPPGGTPLGELHFWAVNCLANERGYGIAALAYGLVGNGALRLCPTP